MSALRLSGIDQQEALRLQRRSLARFVRMVAGAAGDSRLFERRGVVASIAPSVPTRSVPNSVTYDDAGHLADALGDVSDAYRQAGVAAWTAWVHESDDAAAAALRAAGCTLDGEPAAMSILLEDLQQPDPGDLDWDSNATAAEVGAVNDRAYDWVGSGFADALRDLGPSPSTRLYRARVDGEVASVAVIADAGDEASVFCVATDPGHERRGLSSRLLGVALAEAPERGMRTSTLQASGEGEPVYARLGFGTFGRMQMWEHRSA